MALFGNRTQLVRLGLGLLCIAAASVAVVNADGTLKITRTSTLNNPCNGEAVVGDVDVELVVQTNETADGTHVVVHRSFHGALPGNQGNTYQVRSIGNEQFDALAPYYDVPFENNVIGRGGAPDFIVTGTARVFVDVNQNPTGYFAFGTAASCK